MNDVELPDLEGAVTLDHNTCHTSSRSWLATISRAMTVVLSQSLRYQRSTAAMIL